MIQKFVGEKGWRKGKKYARTVDKNKTSNQTGKNINNTNSNQQKENDSLTLQNNSKM